MIGLDTNVLVRYLMQDDREQSRRATERLEQLTPTDPGLVSMVAMAELVWVLERAYRLDNSLIATAVEQLLQVDTLVIEQEQDVFDAMVALKQGTGSFADALIAARSRAVGCAQIVTFDKKALRIPGFTPA